MLYKYKLGDKMFPVSANDAGTYLEKLHTNFGMIDPKSVVVMAKDESNILHNCFEWEDTKAAEGYRILQAKSLIRSIVVVDEKKDVEEKYIVTRAFVNVPMSKEGIKSYHTISAAMENDYSKAMLLKQAERDMIIFQTKYVGLSELSEIMLAMNNYQLTKPIE